MEKVLAQAFRFENHQCQPQSATRVWLRPNARAYEETGSKSEVAMWLGHRRESSTTPYIVRKALAPKHYHTRIAHTDDEEVELSNLGYEYIKDTKTGGARAVLFMQY